MPRVTLAQALSVAANTTTANLMADPLFEFIEKPTKIVLGAAAAAAGINVTLSVGGKILVDDQPVSQAAVFPRIPDDVMAIEMIRWPGRVICRFRNTTGAAVVLTGAFLDFT